MTHELWQMHQTRPGSRRRSRWQRYKGWSAVLKARLWLETLNCYSASHHTEVAEAGTLSCRTAEQRWGIQPWFTVGMLLGSSHGMTEMANHQGYWYESCPDGRSGLWKAEEQQYRVQKRTRKIRISNCSLSLSLPYKTVGRVKSDCSCEKLRHIPGKW